MFPIVRCAIPAILLALASLARPAEDGLRIGLDAATLRPRGRGIALSMRGTLEPADGSPTSSLDLRSRDLRLTLAMGENVTIRRIPPGDPGWVEERSGRWSWRSPPGADHPLSFRYDPGTGAFSVVVHRMGRPSWPRRVAWAATAQFDLTVDGSLAGRSWIFLRRGRGRTYAARGDVDAIHGLLVGGPAATGTLTRKKADRWYRFEVERAGRYRVRYASDDSTVAYITVVPLVAAGDPARADRSWTRGSRTAASVGPPIDVDLVPGTFVLHVDGYVLDETVYSISIEETEIATTFRTGRPLDMPSSWDTSLEIHGFDATVEDRYDFRVTWDPTRTSGWYYGRIQIFGLPSGVVPEVEGMGGELVLPARLPPGKYVVSVTGASTSSHPAYTIEVKGRDAGGPSPPDTSNP